MCNETIRKGWLACLGVLAMARIAAAISTVAPLDFELDGPGTNVDDACIWADPVDPAGSLVFVTTKDSHLVEVHNVVTGAFVTTIPGFGRPNNCAVEGDLLLTTDRTAHEVKVHHIPDFALVRTFGGDLIEAEGIDVLDTADGQKLVYVTDSGDASVHVYDLASGALVRSFPTGFGLRIESILADDRYQRILVAREEGENVGGIGLFTPEGGFVEQFGTNVFGSDTEGMAIYACGDGGYLIAADQNNTKTQFEVFDRVTLTHLGTFDLRDAGTDFSNATDGINLLQTPVPGFPTGVFAACDGCGASLPDETDVVRWERIAAVMGFDHCPHGAAPDCTSTPCMRRIIASADTYVASDAASVNQGSAPFVEIDADPTYQALLRFEVPDISGMALVSATVRLTVDSSKNSDSPEGGALHPSDGAWSENEVVYASRPLPAGPALASLGAVVRSQTVDYDVTAAVRGARTHDFILLGNSTNRVRYRSREAKESPPTLLLALAVASGHAPTVAIVRPADGSAVPFGTPLAVEATAADVEDGDLSAQVRWRSNLDGELGQGSPLTVSLSPGWHTLAADVADGGGVHASASVRVRITTPPVVTLTAPAAGTSVPVGTGLTLAATATDPEDGDVSDGIRWTSDRDGALGIGASITVTLSEGAHLLTASAMDSDDATGAAQVAVTITPAPPTVVITAPGDGAVFVQGEVVTLTATATDATDGDLGGALLWTSDLQGALGGGTSLDVSLELGTHTITARATDSDGSTGAASIRVRVVGGTTRLEAVADTFVCADAPGTSFGADPTIWADADPECQGFLRFAVSGTAGLLVERATLQLVVSDAGSAASRTGGTLHAIADTGWQESTLTWNARPPIDGPALGTLGAVEKLAPVEFDVTAAVSGDGTVVFALITPSGDGVKYKSRETASGRPTLVVQLRSR